MSERMPRVDELLREEISAHISRSLSDPRLGFVTVTSVSTSPDLRHAKVFVSTIGSEEQRVAQYKAVYESDYWKTKIAPRVPEYLDRAAINVNRVVPTPRSPMQ